MCVRGIVVISLVLLSTPALAGEWHAVINGKSIHFEGSGWNEANWGLGVMYDFSPKGQWIPSISGSIFRDSNDQISRYMGAGAKRRYMLSKQHNVRLDLGLFGFVMTREDHRNGNPFLGALPFATLGYKRAGVNVIYIPSVSPKSVPLVYFQFTYKLFEF